MPAPHAAAVARIGRLALEKENLDELLHEATQLVATTLNMEFCKILELQPDRQSFLLRAGVGWKKGLTGQAVVPATGETHAGHTLLSRTPVIVEDFGAETRFRPSLLHDHGAASGVGVVIPGAEPFGVLGVHTSCRRGFSSEEVTFLESVAEILSHAVRCSRTNATIRQSEERFRRTFDDSPIGMTIVGRDYRFVRANRVFCELMGYSEDELKQLTFEQVTHPDDLSRTRELAGKLFRAEISDFRLQKRNLTRTGETVNLDLTVTLVRNDQGQPLHAVSMIENLTPRLRYEKDLLLARFTLDHVQDAIFWARPDGRLIDVNESAVRMLGYSRDELLNMSVSDLDDGVSAEEWPGIWTRLSQRGFSARETQICRKSGRLVPVELSINYLKRNGEEYSCALARDITGRKRSEEELRTSEERYRNLFENSAAMVWTIDLEGNITSINRTGERFLGREREELLGTNIAALLAPGQLEIARRMLEHKLRKGGTTTYELDILTADGTYRPLQISSRLMYEDGKPTGAQAIGIDISERKAAQETLRQSEEHWRALTENIQDIMTILDADGTVRYASPSIERVLGYKPAERVGKSTLDLVHPGDVQEVGQELARGVRTPNAIANLVFRIRHRDGSWRYVEAVARNLLDNPAVAGLVVNTRDITGRKLAEEKIRASEEWFRTSFEFAGVPTAITSLDGRFLRVNPALCRFLGRSEKELLGRSWREFTHSDDVDLSHELRERLLTSRTLSVESSKRYVRKDGRILWGYVVLSLIHDAAGRPNRIAAQISDITERKEAEEALRESEIRFRLAAESASDFIYEWDLSSGRLEWHGDVDRRLGYRPGKFPRTFEGWKQNLHPEDRDRVLHTTERALEQGTDPPDIEYRVRTKKGDYRHWLGRGRCLRDESGKVRKWIGACSDITRRKQIEQALRKSEAELRASQKELRALAGRLIGKEEEEHRRLARDIHDDFNQRLTAVTFDLAELEEAIIEHDAPRLREKLLTARDRIDDLSDDMRRLAHQLHPAAIELLGLPAALRQHCEEACQPGRLQVRFISRKLPESIRDDVALCLYRVTQECLRNIVRHAGADRVSVTLWGTPRGLRLSITDNGRGFEREAGEPKGGLGLISMKERVRLVGGSLSIQSTAGAGTKVRVEVPV